MTDDIDIDIMAQENQVITITTPNGYMVVIHTGHYTNKDIDINVEKIEHIPD